MGVRWGGLGYFTWNDSYSDKQLEIMNNIVEMNKMILLEILNHSNQGKNNTK